MKKSEFQQLFRNGRPLILDGATGTELIKRGMPAGVSPELWVFENPDVICDIHNAYIASGSNIVYAPTFGGNRCKLAEFGLEKRLKFTFFHIRISLPNRSDSGKSGNGFFRKHIKIIIQTHFHFIKVQSGKKEFLQS